MNKSHVCCIGCKLQIQNESQYSIQHKCNPQIGHELQSYEIYLSCTEKVAKCKTKS
jgi:hypothetical protein